jgi:RimJ/RimL family protein N-acetyltransferase
MVLRRFTEADVDALVALDADPEVMRYLTGGRPTPRAVVEREVLPRILREYARREGLGVFAADAREGGDFLGWFELRAREGPAPTVAELGYRLRRPVWGQGLASEGARALVDHGFVACGLVRVVAETMAVNHASRRVMDKAGLRHVRTFHPSFDDPIPGTEHGEVEYALTRDAWLRGRGG